MLEDGTRIAPELRDVEERLRELERIAGLVKARLTQPVYLGKHRALLRLFNGAKMFVDPEDLSLAPHLLLDGVWEPWITRFFATLVRPGSTVIDIGAHVGYYTLLAASWVGPEGRVISFEPDPNNAQLLRLNVEINGFWNRTQVLEIAAVDAPRTLTLYRRRSHSGNHSLVSEAADASERADAVQVSGLPVDSVVQGPIDLVKIDAEGSEPLVIRGMLETIRANPQLTIIMEFAPKLLESGGTDPSSFLRELSELGFRILVLDTDSHLQVKSEREILETEFSTLVLRRVR